MSTTATIEATATLPLSSIEESGKPVLQAVGDEDWVDDEAYRELFVSVIELAIKDYEFLLRIRQQGQLTPSQRKKLRSLTEDGDPEEFFASNWFEDICRMIGIQPEVIRERLAVMF